MSRKRVVLVTGGSRGIGKAVVEQLVPTFDVISVGRRMHGSPDTVVRKSDRHEYFLGDISNQSQCQEMVSWVMSKFGQIDILINNAGICNPLAIREVSFETWYSRWQRTFEVNLFSAVNLTYLCVPYMLAGGGKIINIASRVGFTGSSDSSDYAASKAAMINFTRSMAKELVDDGIYAYSVSPSWVKTDLAMAIEEESNMVKGIPMGRIALPNEVADVVKWLCETHLPYLTGQNIDINGASYFH